ncbi:epoxide hydrolase 4 [Cotesia typhae]|uniref:epoxide hydrolase 4 n=1 Tax=Cotesia typhae TaxID=2053667 RepID=UPI003D685CE5
MKVNIVQVSLWEQTKLHILCFIYGFYLIFKCLLKWTWHRKNLFRLHQRDKPPPCLVDNNLGEHSYVKLKGIKLHYVETGEKFQPLLLLLHGFPDCWLSWREQLPILSEHYRVVALDLKGFGDSDKPTRRRSYRIEVLINELRQFISTLGVDKCSIIGHDLGGLLGWFMTILHSDIIDKFVAISSPHPNLYWDELCKNNSFYRWMHFSRLPFLPEIDALKEDLSIINDTYKHLQINKKNEQNYVEAYKYAFSRREDWTGPINYYRNLPFIRVKSTEPLVNQTLLIVGNSDPFFSLESIVHSSEFTLKSNIKVIKGAQHFPHQEKPDMVNQVILNFLIGPPVPSEKTNGKSIVSTWLGSLTSTVKYGNQMIDAVHKRTNDVVSNLPHKVPYLGHTTT